MFTRRRPPGDGAADTSQAAGRPGPQAPSQPVLPRPQRPDIPGFGASRVEPREGSPRNPAEPDGSKLTVGREIHLKGEITSCDLLIVEGRVEASMNSRYIRIAADGVFDGECEVDIADVAGRFNGNLVARERLVVRSTGRVSGTIRYDRIEIEPGGVVAGNVDLLQPLDAPKRDGLEPSADEQPPAASTRPAALPAE